MSRSNLVGAVILVVFMAVLIAVYTDQYDPKAPLSRGTIEATNKAPVKITIKKLLLAYEKDARRADGVLRGKLCDVTGTIATKDVNWLGEPVIRLKGDSAEAGMVSFIFEKGEAKRVGYLQPEEPITIRGVCQGKVPRYGVRFKQCTVVMEDGSN
ncbi:MAG: hypothetical protein O7G87_01405 [bacterium]|nr:hypothetical protein [bacterium]